MRRVLISFLFVVDFKPLWDLIIMVLLDSFFISVVDGGFNIEEITEKLNNFLRFGVGK